MTTTEIISIILGSSLITSIVSFFLHKKTERVTAEVKKDFDLIQKKLSADLQWKQNACKTMGEIYFHLVRTRKAFDRYKNIKEKNRFLEDEVIKYSNQKIRDLILKEGYLIHPDLTDKANKLLVHYDVWLEKYNKMRVGSDENNDLHVYVGPVGYGFPEDAELSFKEYYLRLWNELYSADYKDTLPQNRKPRKH